MQHLADGAKNEILAINNISCKLKIKRFKMPNAAYSKRYQLLNSIKVISGKIPIRPG